MSYTPSKITVNLYRHPFARSGLETLYDRLRADNATLANGSKVTSRADVVLFLLEQSSIHPPIAPQETAIGR
jgi:hypothetical protein